MNIFADKVFVNGRIYTMDTEDDIFEALAIKAGKILALGKNEEMQILVDKNTEVCDLNGKTVLPGFVEGHVHAPGAAYNVLFNVNLYEAKSLEETMEMIRKFVEENPEKTSYYGRGFNCGFFPGAEASKGPRKERLDEICKDKPIVLTDFGGHMLWLNSKALEINGITADTATPEGGVIEKNAETGELWGILKEYAKRLVPYQSFTDEEAVQSVEWFQREMHSYGYTSVFALRPPGAVIPRETIFYSFQLLERQNQLKLRINGGRDIDPNQPMEEQIEEMFQLKSQYESDLIKMKTAKIFADGVIEGLTGSLLEPYEPEGGNGTDYRGEFIWDKQALKECCKEIMKAGFQIHVHSIGDGATRYTLDALAQGLREIDEATEGKDKQGAYRNTLTHLQLVSPQDVKRMAEMGVVANVQAYWHFKSPVMFPVEQTFIGKRAEQQYPLKSFFDQGVVVAASADHPVTPVPNPFHAIQAGVTRNLHNAEAYNLEKLEDSKDPRWLLWPEQRVTVKDMVKAYTINGAYQLFRENEIGSLEPGKCADMIVLSQNPFEVNPVHIEDTIILETIWNGEVVFRYGE